MFILGNFIYAIAKIVEIALSVYLWIIIVRAVLSWVNPDPYNPIVRIIHQLTEPLMGRVRRWIPIRGMGIDFSPMIILLVIVFLQSFLVPTLIQLAASFR